ncbi:MAG: MBL fold metallo-hydrolase [Alphaproteobacteria bacterium]|nr:MBL fold metallo-hydrolase [Alphaproteobacteria bacterium]MDE2073522.1 MBL fold metallo-hydrolase [Alphaproteobacteria bacterium]MDE2352028.1 MBL fold metallo-hydrolase [Alphaproteobacteria bacterium]
MRRAARTHFSVLSSAAITLLLCLGSSASAKTAIPAVPPGSATPAPQTQATRIILLGTEGGPTAEKFRSEPANLLVVDGTPYLIDAGAGVSRRLPWAGLDPVQIHTIFITHHHVDHNAGLGSLMSLAWFNRSWGNLPGPTVQIYGPPGMIFLVHSALQYLGVSERIFLAGVPEMKPAAPMFAAHDIDQAGAVFQDKLIRVTAAENTHYRFPSYGPNGIKDKGIKDKSYSYRFDTPEGSVVYTGDTGPSAAVTALARNADVLVSEVCADEICGNLSDASKIDEGAQPLPKKMAEAEQYHFRNEHLTPEDVGRMAEAAHVKMVILTHIVSSVLADDGASYAAELTAGVKKYYSGPVIVGRDLFEYDLVGTNKSRPNQ